MSTNLSVQRSGQTIQEKELEALAVSDSDISLERNESGGILCLWINMKDDDPIELQYYDHRLETVQTPSNYAIQKMYELAKNLDADIIDEYGDIWDTQTSELIEDTSGTLGAFFKVVFIFAFLLTLYWCSQ